MASEDLVGDWFDYDQENLQKEFLAARYAWVAEPTFSNSLRFQLATKQIGGGLPLHLLASKITTELNAVFTGSEFAGLEAELHQEWVEEEIFEIVVQWSADIARPRSKNIPKRALFAITMWPNKREYDIYDMRNISDSMTNLYVCATPEIWDYVRSVEADILGFLTEQFETAGMRSAERCSKCLVPVGWKEPGMPPIELLEGWCQVCHKTYGSRPPEPPTELEFRYR